MGAFTAGTCTVACTMHFGRRSTEDVPGMIRVVSWNLFKRRQPWRELAEMARKGNADIALLQEGGNLPADLAYPVRPENEEHWKRHLHDGRPVYDRWCLVVKLSEKIDVDWFRPVLPICEFGEHDRGERDRDHRRRQGDAARPAGRSIHRGVHVCAMDEAPPIHAHPMARQSVRCISAQYLPGPFSLHRQRRSAPQRILGAGNLNIIFGATGGDISLPTREKNVWDRMAALVWNSWGRRRRMDGNRPCDNPMCRLTHGMCRHGYRAGATRLRPIASSTTPSPRAGSTKGSRFAPSTKSVSRVRATIADC